MTLINLHFMRICVSLNQVFTITLILDFVRLYEVEFTQYFVQSL